MTAVPKLRSVPLIAVAVGITHVASPLPTVIVGRLGKKERTFFAPLSVAGTDVGDTEIEEAVCPVQIRRRFSEDLWIVGSWATAGIENDPRITQLDRAGIVWLDRLPAENPDIEVPRFVPVADGKELSREEAFVCNQRVS